jgi:transcriptional regulator with XRE-family HTH domain
MEVMETIIEEQFWYRAKSVLKARGFTQKQAAAACGAPLATFYGWVAKRILPPAENCVALAMFLGVSVEYLVTGKRPDTANRIQKISAFLKKAETELMELRRLVSEA